MKQLILTFIFVFCTIHAVFAHSPIKLTTPQDGAILSSLPEALVMSFASPVRVTKVTLIHKTAAEPLVRDIEITAKSFVKTIKLSPEWDGSGNYRVKWRALAEDGHAMKGTFSFKVIDE